MPRQATNARFGVSISRKVGRTLSRPANPHGVLVLVSLLPEKTPSMYKYDDGVPAEAPVALSVGLDLSVLVFN
jgi:hypothetical protein